MIDKEGFFSGFDAKTILVALITIGGGGGYLAHQNGEEEHTHRMWRGERIEMHARINALEYRCDSLTWALKRVDARCRRAPRRSRGVAGVGYGDEWQGPLEPRAEHKSLVGRVFSFLGWGKTVTADEQEPTGLPEYQLAQWRERRAR